MKYRTKTSTHLYIGVYVAAQTSKGLCSSYFKSYASVGVFSHAARIFLVYANTTEVSIVKVRLRRLYVLYSVERGSQLLCSQHQSLVFCTFLDATSIWQNCLNYYCNATYHFLLFGFSLIHNIYTQIYNLVRVSWCGAVSNYFTADNGVKQGAVLSPILFCMYIDDYYYYFLKTTLALTLLVHLHTRMISCSLRQQLQLYVNFN